MVYTVVAYSVSLKRQVRVVTVVWPGSRSSRTEVLFSTSITMTAATTIALYRARFSMEFPFQDGTRPSMVNRAVLAKTQFAGLSECQSRQVEALHFHRNMALMAVSAARLGQLHDQRAGPLVFCMEFPFRDGKQFAGLSECQSRQVEALHVHWNMAMTAVSAARLSQLSDQGWSEVQTTPALGLP